MACRLYSRCLVLRSSAWVSAQGGWAQGQCYSALFMHLLVQTVSHAQRTVDLVSVLLSSINIGWVKILYAFANLVSSHKMQTCVLCMPCVKELSVSYIIVSYGVCGATENSVEGLDWNVMHTVMHTLQSQTSPQCKLYMRWIGQEAWLRKHTIIAFNHLLLSSSPWFIQCSCFAGASLLQERSQEGEGLGSEVGYMHHHGNRIRLD